MDGRELKKGLAPLVEAVTRQAEAGEALLALAKEEQIVMAEAGPPVCPHCGALDPMVTETGAGGEGPLSHFVMVGETHCCNKPIYAIAEGWVTVPNQDLAVAYLSTKGG